MTALSLDTAINRFKANEARVDRFANGALGESWTTADGVTVPSLRKLVADFETTNDFAATIVAIRHEFTALAVNSKSRPGDNPAIFAHDLEGAPSSLAPVDPNLSVVSLNGRAYPLVGASTIASREAVYYDRSRVYAVRVIYARVSDPIDRAGDSVRVGIKWLDQNYVSIGRDTIINTHVAKSLDGIRTVVAQIKGMMGASPHDGAVYFKVYVQTAGTDGITNVLEIVVQDITDASTYSPDLTVLGGRISSLESAFAAVAYTPVPKDFVPIVTVPTGSIALGEKGGWYASRNGFYDVELSLSDATITGAPSHISMSLPFTLGGSIGAVMFGNDFTTDKSVKATILPGTRLASIQNLDGSCPASGMNIVVSGRIRSF
jgi:hypothetical protein